MEKIDFKKDLKELYSPKPKVFSQIKVPKRKFLMVDGAGDPNTSPDFERAVSLLYPLAYTLKFTCKKQHDFDFAVAPLEGLWWADDMNAFVSGKKSDWKWTLMIPLPDHVTTAMFKQALADVSKKKPELDWSAIRFETYNEGLSVQIMHIGPYAAEAPTISELHDIYLPSQGLVPAGHHHEIYLGDPRKSDPAKLKTIIRQPVKKA